MTQALPACADRTDHIDLCSSSVSSGDYSPPPPRPDSPRLFLADSSAVARARLGQLAVWGDAAEDEREEDTASSPVSDLPPLPNPSLHRMADRVRPSSYSIGYDMGPGLSRRKSLFCGRPISSGSRELGRRPSMWGGGRDRMDRASSPLPASSCGAEMRRPSFRRRGSFHRYSRISGNDSFEKRKPPMRQPAYSDCAFDDLVDGLDATKVSESPCDDEL